MEGAFGGAGAGGGELMGAYEAERAVEALRCGGPQAVGSRVWMAQAHAVERLNLQAHRCVQEKRDEFVVEALVSHDKLPALVRELIACECWKARAFPRLRAHLAQPALSVPAYLVLQYEATLTNLLEVALFHRHACDAAGEDALVELVDYCHRKCAYLVAEAPAYVERTARQRSAEELLGTSAEEDLQEKEDEIRFNTALCALSVLRYITDFAPGAHPGAVARMVSMNDAVIALIPLIDSPPWVRRRRVRDQKKRVLEKFVEGKWQVVQGDERVRVCKHDAQVWLALNNLIVDPECRKRYRWDAFRIDAASKLKRHFNETLFDQLPVLQDLARTVDQTILAGGDTGGETYQPSFILELVPEVYEGFMEGIDWAALVEEQKAGAFDPAGGDAVQSSKAQIDSMVRAFEFMADMERLPSVAQPSEVPEGEAGVEVEVEAPGVSGVVQRLALRINLKRGGEDVEQPAEDLGLALKGKRWRLHSLKDAEPLPAAGALTVRYAGKSARAEFELPSGGDQPKLHWITVGNFGANGFALQIKAKRLLTGEGVSVENLKATATSAYWPEGGVINIKSGDQPNLLVPLAAQAGA